MLFGDETTPDELLKQSGTAFIDGLLGMIVLGGFGAAADLRNEKIPLTSRTFITWL